MKIRQAINNLESDPKYKALDTDKKLSVRSHLFDKFVAPYYKNKGVIVNDESKERWVKAGLGRTLDTKTTVGKPSLLEKTVDLGTHYEASLAKAGTTTARAAIDLHSNIMHGFIKHTMPEVYKEAGHGKLLQKYDRYTGYARDYFNEREDKLNTWLGSDINKDIQTKIVELPGKAAGLVGNHPSYILAGEFVGGIGVLGKGEALTEELLQAGPKGKYIYKALKGAAEGYLAAKGEGATSKEAGSMAKGFAEFEAGVSAIPFLGKLLGLGGPRVLEQSLKAVTSSSKEIIENTSTEKISGAVVKATAKSLSEVAQKLGFKDFWDAQGKGAGKKVISGVSELAGQANKEISVHNPELVAAVASKELGKVSSNPLGGAFINMIRQHVDPVKATVEHVVEATRATSGMQLEKSTVGAASAKSLEFGDNLTKLFQSNVTFEKRSHKFLAALDMMVHLQADLKAEGKESPKWLNEQFMAIMNQLDQDPEFRTLTMTQRIESAKNLMDHVEQVISKGKGDRRIWRSTEVRPGFDKTTNQKQLNQLTSGNYPKEGKQIKDRQFTKTDIHRLTRTLLDKGIRGDDFYATRKVIITQAQRFVEDQNISAKEAIEKALAQLGGK